VVVTSVDATTATVSWTASPTATGYRIWTRNINDGSVSKPGDVTDQTSGGFAYMIPGVWNFEFCVTAVNGDLESPKSQCKVAPRPAGS
jgi:hypothetical protein